MRLTTAWRSTDGTTALRRVPIERRDPREDGAVMATTRVDQTTSWCALTTAASATATST